MCSDSTVLGNLVREEGGVPFAVDGMPEHVHLLARLPASRAVSDIVRAVKAGSSSWLARSVPGFAWQVGYGAFTVSKSGEGAVRSYIENQKRHHAERSYLDEFRVLLKAHGFDPADAEAHMECAGPPVPEPRRGDAAHPGFRSIAPALHYAASGATLGSSYGLSRTSLTRRRAETHGVVSRSRNPAGVIRM